MDDIPIRERCAACQQISPVGFSVSDEVWKAVVHPYFQNSILCLMCFISRADERLIAWDRDIKLMPVSLASHLRNARGLDWDGAPPKDWGEFVPTFVRDRY